MLPPISLVLECEILSIIAHREYTSRKRDMWSRNMDEHVRAWKDNTGLFERSPLVSLRPVLFACNVKDIGKLLVGIREFKCTITFAVPRHCSW
jgi:hypothetical protein